MIPIGPLEFIYNELDENGDQTVCASELSEYIACKKPLTAKQKLSFKVCAFIKPVPRYCLVVSHARQHTRMLCARSI